MTRQNGLGQGFAADNDNSFTISRMKKKIFRHGTIYSWKVLIVVATRLMF